jgi:hypothetical protein
MKRAASILILSTFLILSLEEENVIEEAVADLRTHILKRNNRNKNKVVAPLRATNTQEKT